MAFCLGSSAPSCSTVGAAGFLASLEAELTETAGVLDRLRLRRSPAPSSPRWDPALLSDLRLESDRVLALLSDLRSLRRSLPRRSRSRSRFLSRLPLPPLRSRLVAFLLCEPPRETLRGVSLQALLGGGVTSEAGLSCLCSLRPRSHPGRLLTVARYRRYRSSSFIAW